MRFTLEALTDTCPPPPPRPPPSAITKVSCSGRRTGCSCWGCGGWRRGRGGRRRIGGVGITSHRCWRWRRRPRCPPRWPPRRPCGPPWTAPGRWPRTCLSERRRCWGGVELSSTLDTGAVGVFHYRWRWTSLSFTTVCSGGAASAVAAVYSIVSFFTQL